MIGVSFIMTVYNKRPYLTDVLAAVRRQRGDFAREYVIVDDGSTDGSLALIRDLTAGWENCRIIPQQNQGASAAMNNAVAGASLAYLKLVDADDVLAPNATRRLLDAMTESGAVLAIGTGKVYQPGQTFAWPDDNAPVAWQLMRAPFKRMLRSNALMHPSTMLLRREDYLRVGGADESVCCQDYSIALPLAQLGDFVYLPAVIASQPVAAPGRLTDTQARILHDVTMALGHFIDRSPGAVGAPARLCGAARVIARDAMGAPARTHWRRPALRRDHRRGAAQSRARPGENHPRLLRSLRLSPAGAGLHAGAVSRRGSAGRLRARRRPGHLAAARNPPRCKSERPDGAGLRRCRKRELRVGLWLRACSWGFHAPSRRVSTGRSRVGVSAAPASTCASWPSTSTSGRSELRQIPRCRWLTIYSASVGRELSLRSWMAHGGQPEG